MDDINGCDLIFWLIFGGILGNLAARAWEWWKERSE